MNTRTLAGIAALLAAFALGSVAQDATMPKVVPIKSTGAFDRLKALAGDWEGTNGRGRPARIHYQLTAQGTVLLETLVSQEPDGKDVEMVTAYHLDGDTLMMTHYCVNTQPRMVGTVAGDEIRFLRKDITNYPGAPYGAMRAMTLAWAGKNAITQRWTWSQGGKDISPELFQFERKK